MSSVILGSLLALALVLPLWASEYVIHLGAMILFFAYLGVAWNVLGGYAGQFSFGHAAFFGLGAYTSTLLYTHHGVSPWIGMVLGGLAGVLLGLLSGVLSFRYGLRGPYFALVMLAFAEMLRLIFETWMSGTYPLGLPIPLKGTSFVDFQFKNKGYYFYIVLVMLGGATWLCHRLARSKVGAYWMAVRDSEDAAAVLGVNAFAYKLLAMAISAFLTAVGGTFYAQYFLTLEVNELFGVQMSVEILLSAIIGGAGTVFGPLVGAAALQLLSEGTRVYIRAFSGFDLMVYGCVLIVVIIFLPQGLLEGLQRPYRAVTRASSRA
ncbi:MAG: branched-chain amino acid ABC transporter permease [Candidatus Rokubacteria bacterium]|nr:branched-chain amino acid ABC transporter permease [Candidatus Rokubacteria bacterium]MBI2491540.1 branched-chain amino acid ABC transporter permease [Candidatus Rokubacteria bacterium]MBI4255250.1 branched-chain amino acid ABC transporter permease [Candidatus Rokubacteria bacterium]MBI4627204.1 branched-chain amino acid ABC transporter permease [Candidatus Rokubacteria bacterium]